MREYLQANLDYENKLVRFLEYHDEPRAAATFLPGMHEAAAIITFFFLGLRFLHQGQLKCRKKRVSPHLVHVFEEPADNQLEAFHDRLLGVLRQPTVRDGKWRLLECLPAWKGNWTNDCFSSFCLGILPESAYW